VIASRLDDAFPQESGVLLCNIAFAASKTERDDMAHFKGLLGSIFLL
jgi:hypothetical protein